MAAMSIYFEVTIYTCSLYYAQRDYRKVSPKIYYLLNKDAKSFRNQIAHS